MRKEKLKFASHIKKKKIKEHIVTSVGMCILVEQGTKQQR